MSFAFLAARGGLGPPPPPEPTGNPLLDTRLESLDGLLVIPLNGVTGWTHMPGSTGLEMPPYDIVTNSVPGVPGSTLQDVRTLERPVFIPVFADTRSGDHITHLQMLDAMRDLVDPLTGMFRIVGVTERGERELTVVYTKGMEGADGVDERGFTWRKFGINALACDPFPQARSDRVVEFAGTGTAGAFLGTAGGTDAPWPRALSSSAVIGDNMRVQVTSEVPVYPVLELVGPMDSFAGTVQLADASLPPYFGGGVWSVSIPDGVAAGQSLRIVTDPRARSIRSGTGGLAAGRVARGSSLRPFYPGTNVLSVTAPGGNADTRVRLSWREKFRSLW